MDDESSYNISAPRGRSCGADYVLTPKGNQPTLLGSVTAKLFAATDPGHHLEIDRSHGRRMHRQIWTTTTTTTTTDGIDFPGAAQIFRIRRDVFNAVGERLSKEIVDGITSLHAREATAEAVAAWVRQHWGVENEIH